MQTTWHVIRDSKEELQNTSLEWCNIFRKHGLRMNPDKASVMWIWEQDVNVQILIDGRQQIDNAV